MAQFETWVDVDLKKPLKMHVMDGDTFSQDNRGNLLGVKVTDGGMTVALSGQVMGYCIRADGKTVVVTGQRTQNLAWIELPETAYAAPGVMQIAIRLVNGTQKTVLAAFRVTVQRTSTDEQLDPGGVVPSLEQLLAKLNDMDEAVQAADTATTNANAAAAAINNMTVSATSVTGSPTATISNVDGHKHITFGLVKGDKGDKGDKGNKGDAYTLTAQDKTAIAGIVVNDNLQGVISDAETATANANNAIKMMKGLISSDDIAYVENYDENKEYSVGDYAVKSGHIMQKTGGSGVLDWISAEFEVGDLIRYNGGVYQCKEIDITGGIEIVETDPETGEEITTLPGMNIHEVDEGEYWFDPYVFTPAATIQDAIDEKLAVVATVENGDTAAANHAAGGYLIRNNLLYRATRYITKGDTLTVGDNIEFKDSVDYMLRNHDAELEKVEGWMTAPYEGGKTYEAGSYVRYNGELYTNSAKITSAPATFRTSSWTKVSNTLNVLHNEDASIRRAIQSTAYEIESMIAANETALYGTYYQSLIADNAHQPGDYIVVGTALYEVTAAIAVGDLIEVGTNVKTVEGGLGAVVAELKKQVAQLMGGA